MIGLRENYMGLNENPTMKGNAMSEIKTPNVTPIVLQETPEPKKIRFTKKTKIMCGVALAAVAAGVATLIKSNSTSENFSDDESSDEHGAGDQFDVNIDA